MKTYKTLEDFLAAARQFAGDDIKYARMNKRGEPEYTTSSQQYVWTSPCKIANPPEDWRESQICWDDKP